MTSTIPHQLTSSTDRAAQLLPELAVPAAAPAATAPAAPPVRTPQGLTSAAVVGLGYVGLPTALALHRSGVAVRGVDVSQRRLDAVRSGQVDLLPAELAALSAALRSDDFTVGDDPTAIAEVDAVIICVPTPVDEHLSPDLAALAAACRAVVDWCHPGQLLVLTSTTYVGSTHDLLVAPLATERGLVAGRDVHVAFSPERIDPGVAEHEQGRTPRVVGGVTAECTRRAVDLVSRLTSSVHAVSSAEAAEMTKLYENTFRAVVLALANEVAGICRTLDLDAVEVTDAAATKPYGFLATYPGPGVGGHCIPCDPHYLLWQMRSHRTPTPLIEQAMTSIAHRPHEVVARAVEVLSDLGRGLAGARVLVVGVSYKPGVRDVRETPALEIVRGLEQRGAVVAYHDPLVPELRLPDGRVLASAVDAPQEPWDLVLLHTVHPGADLTWVSQHPVVLDATYRFAAAPQRHVV
ncbi:MAG: nucleotide sugar dehydrogenase [Quadrisphaera sp.]